MATNQPVQTGSTTGDKVKVILAILSVLAGICVFYFLSGQSTYVRIGVLVLGLIIGAIFVWFSSSGQDFIAFAYESVREVKKVVWPARNDSLRVTGIVFGFVLAMAIFLWGSDKVVEFVLYNFILGWKR